MHKMQASAIDGVVLSVCVSIGHVQSRCRRCLGGGDSCGSKEQCVKWRSRLDKSIRNFASVTGDNAAFFQLLWILVTSTFTLCLSGRFYSGRARPPHRIVRVNWSGFLHIDVHRVAQRLTRGVKVTLSA